MPDLFPDNLKGLSFDVKKAPFFSTNVLTAASGLEKRAQFWSYPKWRFNLHYDVLRADSTNEFQTMVAFVLSQAGKFNAFYYKDPTDYHVDTQGIGTGDGATKTFPLVRSIGGFTEPVAHSPSVSKVYLNGVEQVSGWSLTASTYGRGSDTITFTSAPANGVLVTADFDYYFYCRFMEDETEFNNFMYRFWELQQLEFLTVK